MLEQLQERVSVAKQDALTYRFRAINAIDRGATFCASRFATAGKLSALVWLRCIQELHEFTQKSSEITGRWDNLPAVITIDFAESKPTYLDRKNQLTRLLQHRKIDRADYARMCKELQIEIYGETLL